MNIIRFVSVALLAASFTTLAACSDDGNGSSGEGGSGEGGSGAGTSSGQTTGGGNDTTSGGNTTTSGGNDTTSGGNTTTTGSGSTEMDWKGTWSVDATYTVSCDYGFDNIKTKDWVDTQALTIEGDGSGGLAVSFPQHTYHAMGGTSTSKGITLSGQYPIKDTNGDTAGAVEKDNNVTIKLTDIVDANEASGTITGLFVGQFGADCTIMNGTVTFVR